MDECVSSDKIWSHHNKAMKTKNIGVLIVALGFIYACMETAFFGSSFLPSCANEVIADGIALMVCSLGWVIIAIGRQDKP